MDQTEQQYIDGLFDRLRGTADQSGPRDGEVERYIQQIIARQPSLTYYMAQALIVQEEALKSAQQHIDELEREIEERPAKSSGGGSFLGGLFGGGGGATPASRPSPASYGGSVPSAGSVPRAGSPFDYPRGGQMEQPPYPPYGQQQPPQRSGGGFLAGAAQTAAGVAGGVLLGNMLGDMFGGHKASPAHAADAAKPEAAKPEAAASTEQHDAAPQNDPFANTENVKYDDDDSINSGFFDGGDDDFGTDI